MDKLIRRAILFDYYGELLNEKQRSIAEEIVSEDLSLSEIGEQEGISRQAVSDMLKRIDEKLESFEAKLGLVKRAERVKKLAAELKELAGKPEPVPKEKLLTIAEKLSEEL